MGRPPTSRVGRAEQRLCGTDGFTLIEVVCVLAIVGLLAAIIVPSIPHTTSRARLEGYALETAALLKADRNAAIRRQATVTSFVDASARLVISGATRQSVRVPADVTMQTTLASRCGRKRVDRTIDFFASGLSCGGVVTMVGNGAAYQIRVNWLTGGIDVAPLGRL